MASRAGDSDLEDFLQQNPELKKLQYKEEDDEPGERSFEDEDKEDDSYIEIHPGDCLNHRNLCLNQLA